MVLASDVVFEYDGPYRARARVLDKGEWHLFDVSIDSKAKSSNRIRVVERFIPQGTPRSPANEQLSINHEIVRSAAGAHFRERRRLAEAARRERDREFEERFPA